MEKTVKGGTSLVDLDTSGVAVSPSEGPTISSLTYRRSRTVVAIWLSRSQIDPSASAQSAMRPPPSGLSIFEPSGL
jgi:hypothetical protein